MHAVTTKQTRLLQCCVHAPVAAGPALLRMARSCMLPTMTRNLTLRRQNSHLPCTVLTVWSPFLSAPCSWSSFCFRGRQNDEM